MIKILLVDDHRIVREGLSGLLRACSDFDIVAEAGDGKTAIELAKEIIPDVIIMDISLPDMNGIEATREILESNPKIKIIALSMHTDSCFVRDMLDSGASGYLLKDCASDELSRAVLTVSTNQIYVSPSIANKVIKDYRDKLGRHPEHREKLSARELTILRLLSEGKSVKDIARKLNVSPKTIETLRQRIMYKIGIHSIAELTRYAIRIGLTPLE